MLVEEVAVISVAGGVCGLLLSRWFARVILSSMPAVGFPIQLNLSTDWRVFTFAVTLSAISAGLFGLWPSIRISRVGLLAYSMVQRTREVGIRVALGATRWDVLRVLTAKTALMIAGSAAIGLSLSFVVSRLLTPLLLESPTFSSYGA